MRRLVRWGGVEVTWTWSPTGSRWLFVGAGVCVSGVAVGLFVELSVFICYLDLRIIGLVRLRTGRVMVSCEDGEWCWTTSSSEGRSCGQKEVDSESILNFSLPFVRIFPWIKGLFWCKIVGYYPRREVANIASWWVCDHETTLQYTREFPFFDLGP